MRTRTPFAVALLLAAAAVTAPAQSPVEVAPPPRPWLTPERAARLKVRDQAFAEMKQLQAKGDLKGAIGAAERVVATVLDLHGDGSMYTVVAWSLLAELREQAGDWAAAEEAAREKWAATAKAYGDGHWRTVDARLGVDGVRLRGRLSPAGREQVAAAAKLAAEAEALSGQNRLPAAADLRRKVADARREVLGPTHPDTLSALRHLAALHHRQGRYADAEPLLLEALAGLLKTHGPAHPATLDCSGHLSALYDDQGRYADAEPLRRETLAGYRKVYGDGHPRTLMSLDHLAGLYISAGRHADAEPLLLEALAGSRTALGHPHPETLRRLSGVAALRAWQGDYAEAEALHKEALAGLRKALGEAHPETFAPLRGLASVYRAQKRYAEAEPLYQEALAGLRKTLGDAHPRTLGCLTSLAVLHRLQGRPGDAARLAGEGLPLIADHLERSSVVQSEAAQLAHAAKERWHFVTYLWATESTDPAATYALVLRWRGAVTARQTFARATRAADPAAQNLLADLTAVTRQLATLANNPPPPEQKVDVPARMKELAARRADLEARLAARSATFDRYVKNRALAPADLQKALPDGAALVDYVEYLGKLVAFVVRKDGVARVELGEAKPVAAAADAFRQTLTRRRPTTGKPDDPAVALRTLVWEPVAKHLGATKLVLVCPDGPLCRVPLAALPGADPDKFLIEEVALAVVPVPRLLPELLADRGPKNDAPPTLFAVGDVDFDALPGDAVAAAPADGTWKRKRAGEAGTWGRLPGTVGELAELSDAFKKAVPGGTLTTLREKAATEAAVRDQLGRHEFLHFATHGFFARPDPAAKKDAPDVPGPDRSGPVGPHPGLTSGLVLAGANKPKGDDDGVLTALEVGDLDLSRVELAVLSACETGLGEVAGGEGVLGLQRAFQVAGARTTVTSLWKVDDDATRKLMGRFYANYWTKNMGALEALREAQVWMLTPGPDRGMKFKDEPADGKPRKNPPYYWAAFVLSGDWR